MEIQYLCRYCFFLTARSGLEPRPPDHEEDAYQTMEAVVQT